MAANQTVDWILQQSKRYPLLTQEQEIHYGRQVQEWVAIKDQPITTKEQKRIYKRGKRAYDIFYLSNIRLVVEVAKRYQFVQSMFDPEDLIQEGFIGLERAIVKFDPTRGYKFSTYAFNWIRQAISRGINSKGKAVRLPEHAYGALKKAADFSQAYELEHGRKPSIEAAAQRAGLELETFKNYLRHSKCVISLDERVRGAGSDSKDLSTMLDLIADIGVQPQMVDEIDNVFRVLEVAVSELQPRQQEVIKAIYANTTEKPASFTSLARGYGVTREAVRSQHIRALNVLRCKLSRRLTRDDLDSIQSVA